jgi:hypothetical protein
VSALPLASVREELKQNRLALLEVKGWPLKRSLLVVRHAQKYVFRGLAEFLDVMRAELRPRLGV